GKWGLYDCSGLIGESNTPNDYAFFMNVVEQAGALVPMVRYDDRYARAVGKWVLNAANALRLLYPDYLPDDHQDSQVWAHQYDPTDAIAHEAMRSFDPANSQIAPFATGDAIAGGWAQTNLGLYGSAHVGILGAIIDTTNIPMILRLDLLKTDYFHSPAYPSYLYFNPYAADTSVAINVGSTAHDLYNTVTKTYLAQNASGATTFLLPANSAAIVVLIPSGGNVTYDLEKMLINGIVVDYHSSHAVSNHPPRIKSLSPDSSRTVLGGTLHFYCTATDRDSDVISYTWSASRGAISGTGSVISWQAPDSAALCTISCTVSDGRAGTASATDTVTVYVHIDQPPVIKGLLPVPRKVNLGATSLVSCTASDPDGDSLAYFWSATGGTFTGSGSSVTWHAPSAAGDYLLRCTVDDGHGSRVSDSTGCEVRDLSIVQTGDLVAYYPFDGDASDASGHNRNGVASNLQPAVDRFGKANSAFAFNGTNSVVVVPNDSGLNFQTSISVNVWVKASAFYPSREQYIISHGSWQNRWKISITPGVNTVRWTVKNAVGTVKDLDAQSPLVLDSLVNVTAVYDGTEMEIYFNGQLDSFAPFTGAINSTTIALTIGQDLPTDTQYGFNGILDDVRLYNYALPLSTIASLYDLTSVRRGPGADLPVALELLQNYPNPFNPSTTIAFAVPGFLARHRVSLRVFDVLGRQVAMLFDGPLPAGRYSVPWAAGGLASGVYLCRLESGGTVRVEKMVLMK
ncbi:MAG TPA: LamG-like jellyroll fold domain-containing protein, partial [Bacteroidota bacterium]|nr:LamG-like jellyroll fold domain-containing protein [Bacteroidota bacterium]